jgi:hypothetical protein
MFANFTQIRQWNKAFFLFPALKGKKAGDKTKEKPSKMFVKK